MLHKAISKKKLDYMISQRYNENSIFGDTVRQKPTVTLPNEQVSPSQLREKVAELITTEAFSRAEACK